MLITIAATSGSLAAESATTVKRFIVTPACSICEGTADPVSGQRSMRIDSTICRTSDSTVSVGASSEVRIDHQANAIDVEDPDVVV